VSRVAPVVVILGTGEGKSLLYMLPYRLPGAEITVLLMPLGALKENIIRKYRAIGIKSWYWGGTQCVVSSEDR
jgi:superfamily II DNA helicase RecQ